MKKEHETTLESVYICLEGESLNLNQLPPSQAVNILKAFVDSLKKLSNKFRIKSIEQGSLVFQVTRLPASALKPPSVEQVANDVAREFPELSNLKIFGYRNPHTGEFENLIAEAVPTKQATALEITVEKWYEGKVMDVGGVTESNVHIQVQELSKVLKLSLKQETAKELAKHLYDDICVFAEVSQPLFSDEVKGISLLSWYPLEKSRHNPEELDKKFQDIVKKYELSNLTQEILRARGQNRDE